MKASELIVKLNEAIEKKYGDLNILVDSYIPMKAEEVTWGEEYDNLKDCIVISI